MEIPQGGNRRSINMSWAAPQNEQFNCRFGVVLRFYADLSMWDEKDPKMAHVKASIETSNEGLYFGKHYGNQIESHAKGEF